LKRTAELKRTAFVKSLLEPVARVRLKTCAACKLKFIPARPLQKCCSGACAQQHVAAEKARKAAKERREGLAKLKTRADYLKDAQTALNAWIRLGRDLYEPCISCGRHHDGQYHAGHFLSRGAHPNLALVEANLAKQCQPCNVHLSGNALNFRRGLIARIGMEAVEALESDDTPRKYSIDELKAIKTQYVAKLRHLREA
jgi:hypothetical protein